jgi:chromosome segregation ATPase
MRQQQIETLEMYLSETKDALNKIQASSSAQLEQQLDKFNEERRELIAKIEKLTADLTRKERQITTLENQKETLTQQMGQKEKQLQQYREEGSQEKNEMNDKIEAMRLKHSETLDELTQKKIEFERDKALKSQQLQFQEQRITELSR